MVSVSVFAPVLSVGRAVGRMRGRLVIISPRVFALPYGRAVGALCTLGWRFCHSVMYREDGKALMYD